MSHFVASPEVSLELDLRSPLNWEWFAQIVSSAKSEVEDSIAKDEDLKKQREDRKQEERQQREAARLKAKQEADERIKEEMKRHSEMKKHIETYNRVLNDIAELLKDAKSQESGVRAGLEATKQRVEAVMKELKGNFVARPIENLTGNSILWTEASITQTRRQIVDEKHQVAVSNGESIKIEQKC